MNKHLIVLTLMSLLNSCQDNTTIPKSRSSSAIQKVDTSTYVNYTTAHPHAQIVSSDISGIKFPAANPTQSELVAALTKAPANGGQILTLDLYNTLPLKDRQLIAILINRGLMSWEGSTLVDFHNDPVTLSTVEDYINRLDLFLAAAQVKETSNATQTIRIQRRHQIHHRHQPRLQLRLLKKAFLL